MSKNDEPEQTAKHEAVDVIKLATEYLAAGGLFNPELMEHENVRDLIIQLRDAVLSDREKIARLERERDDAIALNHLYHKTRQEHRDFAKNAQQQRDDWKEEAAKLARKCHMLLGHPEKLVLLDDVDALLSRLGELLKQVEQAKQTIARLEAEMAEAKDKYTAEERLRWQNVSADFTKALEERESLREKLSAATALAERLAKACHAFRDAVLNQRGSLEEPCLDNDQINAVLRQFDDDFQTGGEVKMWHDRSKSSEIERDKATARAERYRSALEEARKLLENECQNAALGVIAHALAEGDAA